MSSTNKSHSNNLDIQQVMNMHHFGEAMAAFQKKEEECGENGGLNVDEVGLLF
jgi:hypothetical protein